MSEHSQENPYSPSDVNGAGGRDASSPSKFRRFFGLTGLVVAILLVVVALFLPAPRSAPQAAKRMTCQKNIREVGLGSHYFNSADIRFDLHEPVVERGGPNRKWQRLISFTPSDELDTIRRKKIAKPRPSPDF
jgi:hypothetical protein